MILFFCNILNKNTPWLVSHIHRIIKHCTVREDNAVFILDSVGLMSVAKEVVAWFYLHHLVPQWCVSPMDAARFVENHDGWFVCDEYIHVMRYQLLWMVVGQTEELYPVDFATFVLKEIYVDRQVLNTLSIPQT